nr:hypothetical protein [Pseudomonas syringae]
MEYIKQNGSLNLGTRVEHGFALVAMMVNRSVGGKSELSDFLPDRSEPEPEVEGEEASAQDVFLLLRGLAKPEAKVPA